MTDVLLRRVRPDQIREVVLLLVIVVAVVFFATQIDDFLSGRIFNRITTDIPIISIVAVGQVLVVLTRNIDLSVGSQVGLVAWSLGMIIGQNPELNPLVLVGIGVAMGIVMGAINGLIVAYGRVPAIITTLATLALFRSVFIAVSDAQTVTISGFPDWLLEFPRVAILELGDYDVRLSFAIALAALAAGQLVLSYLPFGRRLYAIGSNPEAARTAGLPMQRDVFAAFVACGAMCGLAGAMFLAKFGTITISAGVGIELAVVAAVVVGGVNIFGGSGSMIGAFLGAILVSVLDQGLLRMPGVSDLARDFVLGLMILAAVASDKLLLGRLQDLWIRARRREQAVTRAADGSRDG